MKKCSMWFCLTVSLAMSATTASAEGLDQAFKAQAEADFRSSNDFLSEGAISEGIEQGLADDQLADCLAMDVFQFQELRSDHDPRIEVNSTGLSWEVHARDGVKANVLYQTASVQVFEIDGSETSAECHVNVSPRLFADDGSRLQGRALPQELRDQINWSMFIL